MDTDFQLGYREPLHSGEECNSEYSFNHNPTKSALSKNNSDTLLKNTSFKSKSPSQNKLSFLESKKMFENLILGNI